MAETVFCDRASVKVHSPISGGWNGFDQRIDDLILSSTIAIRSFCRRNFDKVTDKIEYFNSPDTYNNSSAPGYKIRVEEPPIAAASLTVEYDYTGMWGTNIVPITLTENTDYVVDYTKGIIEFFTLLDPNTRGLRAKYNGGYDIGTETPNPIVKVPGTVKHCCVLQTIFTLERIASMTLGEEQQQRASRSLNRYTTSATTGLLSELQGLLAPYRHPMVGSR